MLQLRLTAWGPVHPCSPIQVRIRSKLLPELEPKKHRTLFKMWTVATPEMCEPTSLRDGHTLLSCEFAYMWTWLQALTIKIWKWIGFYAELHEILHSPVLANQPHLLKIKWLRSVPINRTHFSNGFYCCACTFPLHLGLIHTWALCSLKLKTLNKQNSVSLNGGCLPMYAQALVAPHFMLQKVFEADLGVLVP